MNGTIRDFFITRDRKQILTIELKGDFREQYEELKDKELDIEIKRHREKRSKSANSYMWWLCGEIAKKLDRESSEEVYLEHVLSGSVYKQIEIPEEAHDTLKASWNLHGIGWPFVKVDYAERDGYIIVRLYYGSSTYNTKQMSRLIDGLVQDAQALGIETKPQEELDSLLASWRPEMRSA